MQRGSIEHEQIIYESSNRRMKQLMDWLSNVFSLRRVVWTGWRAHVGLFTLLVCFHTLCWAAKGSPE